MTSMVAFNLFESYLYNEVHNICAARLFQGHFLFKISMILNIFSFHFLLYFSNFPEF
jgi:hypothetical protein